MVAAGRLFQWEEHTALALCPTSAAPGLKPLETDRGVASLNPETVKPNGIRLQVAPLFTRHPFFLNMSIILNIKGRILRLTTSF